MKECSKCKIIKDDSMFGKSKETISGLQSWCKKCKAEARIEKYRTPYGLVSTIYQGQMNRSKKRGHHLPKYSRDELYNWCVEQENFIELFNKWKESCCDKKKSPSIDRLDDSKGYCFTNIRLVSFQENMNKSHKDSKDGTGTRETVVVLQYTKKGEFIREFRSVAFASRELNIIQQNIFKVLNGERNSAGGFIWIKKDGNSGYKKKVDN